MSRQRGMVDPRVADAAIFLARYDRQVADVFLTQAMSSQPRSRNVYDSSVIRAMAALTREPPWRRSKPCLSAIWIRGASGESNP